MSLSPPIVGGEGYYVLMISDYRTRNKQRIGKGFDVQVVVVTSRDAESLLFVGLPLQLQAQNQTPTPTLGLIV